MTIWQRLLLAVSSGYIFFFISERVFWSFWRIGPQFSEGIAESPGEVVITCIAYMVFAYAFLALVDLCRVRSVWALFLAGAVFGWLVEGIYAMTFFGAGGIPLPFSISWTALAWHALLSVLLVWYYLRVSLSRRGYLHTMVVSMLVGLFWGIWSTAWALETPPLVTDAGAYFGHALLMTGLLMLSFWLARLARSPGFQTTWIERIVLLGLIGAFTAFVTFMTVGILLAILLAFLGFSLWLLARNRSVERGPSAIAVYAEPIAFGKYLVLLLIPIVATAVYALANAVGIILPTNLVIMVATTAAGFGMFILASYKVFRRRV